MEKTISFGEMNARNLYRIGFSFIEKGQPIGHGREGAATIEKVVIEVWVPGTEDRRISVVSASTLAGLSCSCIFAPIIGVEMRKEDAASLRAWVREQLARVMQEQSNPKPTGANMGIREIIVDEVPAMAMACTEFREVAVRNAEPGALDWMAASALGLKILPQHCLRITLTSDWCDGGPALEMAGIYATPDGEGFIARRYLHGKVCPDSFVAVGPTALVAGFRCLVLNTLGPTVAVPKVLVSGLV